MRTFKPLFLLGALSVAATGAVAKVDTSQWKCETCPFEKDNTTSGTLDVGVGGVAGDTAKFGDYTGLYRKKSILDLGGTARYRGQGGIYGSASASDLGLDSRTLAAEVGQEGRYRLSLGYAEIPRYFADEPLTPFLGIGGSVLTLPAVPTGFPAGTTAAMPLGATLRPVELGYKRSALDAALAWLFTPAWSTRVSVRHDVRDGTQSLAGSFFSTSSQLVAPVDQVTDQLEVSASYFSHRLQATVAYQGSLFRNGQDSLTWSNPFQPVLGATRGQLALAPDNEFHQIMASAGYEITPIIRASGDIAFGRMTQDSAFLKATLNTANPPFVPAAVALPAQSLSGRADTFNASLRVTATPSERVRVNASYARDVRDNRTDSLSYPAVSTDIFLGATPRSNQPFSFWQDRFKVNAEYRAPGHWKASAGIDEDDRERSLQEVVTTRETTLWGRVVAQPRDNVSLALKLAHAQRNHSAYGVATWVNPPENPLLRKYYLADRSRDTAGLRADIGVGDSVNIGLSADYANDDYDHSTIGLTEGRSVSVGADVSVALAEQTQVHFFAQSEQIRSRQAGSQVYAQADWWAKSKDAVDVVGLGVKHSALKGKLDLGADLTYSRSRSDVAVDAGPSSAPFPTATTALDSVKLYATYRLKDNLSLTGSYWYEHYDTKDWRLDGVTPATVSNLLTFGVQPPRYNVNVVRLGVRYRF